MSGTGKISFWAAVLMSINIIVGVGIYFGPQIMVEKAGNFSFLGWGAAGLMLFPVIWCVALASRMFPGPGGFFNYCSQGLGSTWGFIAAWAYFLGFSSTGATQATVLKETFLNRFDVQFLADNPIFFTFIIICALTLLNLLSVKVISQVQSFATLLKLAPLFLIVAIFVFYWDSSLTYTMGDFSSVPATIPMAIFGYWGFESCCNLSQHLEGGPSKTFSVILTAFVISMSLYTFFHFGLLHIMGPETLAQHGVPSFIQFLGIQNSSILAVAELTLVLVFILNYFNAVYGVMLSNVANIIALAERKLTFLPDKLVKENKYFRPTLAVFFQGLVIFLLMSCVPYKEVLYALANLGVMTALVLTLASVLRVQVQQKSYVASVVTILGFVTCSILFYFTWMEIGIDHFARLMYAMPLIAGVLLGCMMYAYKRNKAKGVS